VELVTLGARWFCEAGAGRFDSMYSCNDQQHDISLLTQFNSMVECGVSIIYACDLLS